MDPRKAFLLKFALFVGVLYGVIVIPAVDRHAVQPLTRGIAIGTAGALRVGGLPVKAEGTLVQGGGASVNIENGCNGLEAAVILFAAVLAFPATWRSRAAALIVGFLGIQALNLVRTTSLFLFLKYKPKWFDAVHTGVWQSALVIAAVGFFLLWSSRQQKALDEEPAS